MWVNNDIDYSKKNKIKNRNKKNFGQVTQTMPTKTTQDNCFLLDKCSITVIVYRNNIYQVSFVWGSNDNNIITALVFQSPVKRLHKFPVLCFRDIPKVRYK